MTGTEAGFILPPDKRMGEETRTLAYRYRLRLTESQEEVLESSQEQLRLVWNNLVRAQRRAEREWQQGRAASVKNSLAAIRVAMQPRGQALTKARRVAKERAISPAAALRLFRLEDVEKAARIPVRKKDGSRCLRFARQHLATEYADAFVNALVDHNSRPSLGAALYNGVRNKFAACSEMWLKGQFRRPRFKRRGEPVALQTQIPKGSGFAFGPVVNLTGFGGQALKRCAVIVHRPLPVGATIRQIAIAGLRGNRHLVVMFNAPAREVAKDFPTTHRTVGIDPGLKVSLTLTPQDSPDFGRSDSFQKQPALARDERFLKRLRRLQRHHDRQRRANNPDCFDAQGRWIKGRRAKVVSHNMARTQTVITAMQSHLAESRRDFYHNAACEILRRFDNVAIGQWRPAMTRLRKPASPSPKGLGAARRAVNRIAYDHALSTFIAYLKDKASRATTPKQVREVSEAHTTRHCPRCDQPTGPTGREGLSVREWTCVGCGLAVLRDAAAAWQIAQRFSTEVASTSQLAEPQGSAAQRRRQRRPQVPVADEAVPVRAATASAVTTSQKPLVASVQVTGQACHDARASQSPVTAVDASASCAVDTPDTLRKPGTLAKAAGASSGSTTKKVRRRRAC